MIFLYTERIIDVASDVKMDALFNYVTLFWSMNRWILRLRLVDAFFFYVSWAFFCRACGCRLHLLLLLVPREYSDGFFLLLFKCWSGVSSFWYWCWCWRLCVFPAPALLLMLLRLDWYFVPSAAFCWCWWLLVVAVGTVWRWRWFVMVLPYLRRFALRRRCCNPTFVCIHENCTGIYLYICSIVSGCYEYEKHEGKSVGHARAVIIANPRTSFFSPSQREPTEAIHDDAKAEWNRRRRPSRCWAKALRRRPLRCSKTAETFRWARAAIDDGNPACKNLPLCGEICYGYVETEETSFFLPTYDFTAHEELAQHWSSFFSYQLFIFWCWRYLGFESRKNSPWKREPRKKVPCKKILSQKVPKKRSRMEKTALSFAFLLCRQHTVHTVKCTGTHRNYSSAAMNYPNVTMNYTNAVFSVRGKRPWRKKSPKKRFPGKRSPEIRFPEKRSTVK